MNVCFRGKELMSVFFRGKELMNVIVCVYKM